MHTRAHGHIIPSAKRAQWFDNLVRLLTCDGEDVEENPPARLHRWWRQSQRGGRGDWASRFKFAASIGPVMEHG